MDDLVEKRVFAGGGAAAELVVAAASGLVRVSVADGRVGEFGLARRCSPRDVSSGSTSGAGVRLAVATEADVLLADGPTVDGLEPSGFGEAVAVTVHGDRVIAGGPDGRLAYTDGGGWQPIDTLPAAPRSLAGGLVGTPEGVYRLVDGALRPAGLSDVRAVALVAGTPLAATAAGLYELGNGWLDAVDGAFEHVAGAPDGRAHAATADGLFARLDGEWVAVELPNGPTVRAVAYGPTTYLVTGAGDLLVEADDGWERTALGVEGVTGAAMLDPA